MKKKRLWLVPVMAIALILWILWANTAPVITRYTVRDRDVPPGFRGFRIAQVSDVHDADVDILSLLAEELPDLILITGDFVDCHRTDVPAALSLASQLAKIAPTYYATGNHEAALSAAVREELLSGLWAAGVTVLQDGRLFLTRGGNEITLIGLDDIGMIPGDVAEKRMALTAILAELETGYSLVLAHRPDLLPEYIQAGADLVFSGHAHGGQVRLPLVGGLYAPGQGFFPEYDAGVYREQDTVMVVSRGIGNSLFPLRVFNRPEVVIVTLEGEY